MYIQKYDSGEENSETLLGSSMTNELLMMTIICGFL